MGVISVIAENKPHAHHETHLHKMTVVTILIPSFQGLRKKRVAYKLSRLIIFDTLKEQYPVTAHAPNFDFWAGCREIKRCEESKRTLKNSFASRMAEFDTTLKLHGITDQLYIVTLSFDLGEIGIFWRYFYCRWPEDQKMGSAFMAIEGLFLLLASIQA